MKLPLYDGSPQNKMTSYSWTSSPWTSSPWTSSLVTSSPWTSSSVTSSSGTSSSTWGGVDYDVLCKGVIKYYSFNLCDLSGLATVPHAVGKLYLQIVATTCDLETQSGKRIGGLYIGKTFVRRKKRIPFNPMDPNTFTKSGISSRWGKHKATYHGMVVLGVITREIAATMGFEDDPEGTLGWLSKQEKCVLEIEKWLQYRFRDDGRFPHGTHRPGRTTEGRAIGYVIYLCFSYLDERRA